ncbi:hypothetical protein A2Y99_02175 [Candidatus Gottesmanbacteria bacterium RBG_13_37_7]|uniref:Multidrug ABC transporter substrate-binding protein n=1 Tax=Candidatus Gottesmanbacteria bacterium RBG_13_37_7 TaxID=1798369 RepID=A0A1F5YIZ0_9BACT|nr:MAG: hypothetical protein A2Y99_02175 [Candidatus Gottesmanbacteria bacterium RBG_13_37_7]
MFNLIFISKSAFEDFKRNKIRTFLTALGILIGVSSVIILMALGLGFKKYIKDQFESLGTNLVMILPGQILQGGNFRSSGSAITGIRFDEKDVQSLKKIKKAEYIVPTYMKSVTVSGNGQTEIGSLYATTADVFIIRNLEIDRGVLFNTTDTDKRSKKAVIGAKIAEKLFGSAENAIGKTIKIEDQGFPITGVLKAKGGGGFGGPDLDSFVFVPYKASSSYTKDKKFYAISIKIANEEDVGAVKEEIKTVLLKRYEEDEFSVVEQTEILNAVSSIFSILNSVLVAIAAISLLVGGIGIMNIMYVSVIERVREIGIRRALGALAHDILVQFIAEAVILSLLGGLLGLVLAFIVVLFIQKFFPAYIDLTSVLIAIIVSSVIGIIFGVFPAKKASDLSPIEAIRYE